MVPPKEENMTKTTFLKLWSLAMGSMDALTGILLVFFPSFVLNLLQIPSPSPDALVFVSWIGVFVMSVGLSYGFALGKSGHGPTVWAITSLVRYMVAVFIAWKIIGGSLHPAWALVAIADGAVAIVQTAVLRAGWWREVPR
jgi:hypothetical protein